MHCTYVHCLYICVLPESFDQYFNIMSWNNTVPVSSCSVCVFFTQIYTQTNKQTSNVQTKQVVKEYHSKNISFWKILAFQIKFHVVEKRKKRKGNINLRNLPQEFRNNEPHTATGGIVLVERSNITKMKRWPRIWTTFCVCSFSSFSRLVNFATTFPQTK